jgi:hypothetical protein
MRRIWYVCSILLMLQLQGFAQSVTNGSFESPTLGDGANAGVNTPLLIGSNSSTVGNWDMTASALLSVPLGVAARVEIINPTGAGPTGISGSQLARLSSNGLAGVGTSGLLAQDIGVSFTANTRYILTADLGLANIAAALSTFGMQITAGGSPVATRNHSTILSLFANSNQLYNVSLIFDTTATPPVGNVGVQFFQTSLAGVAGVYLVDNVSLTTVAAVPEPATIGLLIISAIGAAGGWYRYRRNQKKQFDAMVKVTE